MSGQTLSLSDTMKMVDDLSTNCPSSNDFDHGFGLDFTLSLPRWIDVAPQTVRYIIAASRNAEGARRGHVLGLAFAAAARPEVLDQLQSQNNHSLAQQIVEAVRENFPIFVQYLLDDQEIVRYWAIWGIWMSNISDSRSVLATHLQHESSANNRDVILSLIDPNWVPSEPTSSPE